MPKRTFHQTDDQKNPDEPFFKRSRTSPSRRERLTLADVVVQTVRDKMGIVISHNLELDHHELSESTHTLYGHFSLDLGFTAAAAAAAADVIGFSMGEVVPIAAYIPNFVVETIEKFVSENCPGCKIFVISGYQPEGGDPDLYTNPAFLLAYHHMSAFCRAIEDGWRMRQQQHQLCSY